MSRIASLLAILRARFSGRQAIVTSVVGRVTASRLVAMISDPLEEKVRAFVSLDDACGWVSEGVGAG